MSAPFHDGLWLVPLSVFFGGLIGSPHCMTMCGPIVMNFAAHRSSLFAYQMGRMISYCAIGAIVGAFGDTLLGIDRPLWLSGVSLFLISGLLIINGYRALSGKALHFPVPRFASGFSARLWRLLRMSSLPPSATAAAAGILTVFLPCGHLYSFLIGAVVTGSPMKGAAFMFAFWLGSAPLLSVSGTWLQRILRPRIEGGQKWAGVLLVAAGLFSILSFGARAKGFSEQLHHNAAGIHEQVPAGHCH